MQKELKEKLEKIIEHVEVLRVDPDICIEYCIPEVATTSDTCDVSGEPYILLTYAVSQYTRPERKIRLGRVYLEKTPEEMANIVTASIEEFKAEIDSKEIG